MAWNRGGGGGASLAPLKNALQYADDELGIDVATASYSEICDALADYFPEITALIPILTDDTYVIKSGIITTNYAWHAFDGDDTTPWISEDGSTNKYIGYVAPTDPIRVKYCTFTGYHNSYSATWFLQYSDEDGQWHNAGSASVGTSNTRITIESTENNPHWRWRLWTNRQTAYMVVYTMQLYGNVVTVPKLMLYDNGTENVPWQSGVATITGYTNKGGFEKGSSGMVGRVSLVSSGNTFISVNTQEKVSFGNYTRFYIETTNGLYQYNCKSWGDAYLVIDIRNYSGNRSNVGTISSSKSGFTDSKNRIADLYLDYYAISSGYHDVTIKKVWCA